jgi:hypothetical protein
MTLQTNPTEEANPGKHLDMFSDLRTYPSQWDVSELSNHIQIRNHDQPKQQPDSHELFSTPLTAQEDPQYHQVSFSEWSLGAQLDRYEADDSNHFSAL